jgi:hypothetical protein
MCGKRLLKAALQRSLAGQPHPTSLGVTTPPVSYQLYHLPQSVMSLPSAGLIWKIINVETYNFQYIGIWLQTLQIGNLQVHDVTLLKVQIKILEVFYFCSNPIFPTPTPTLGLEIFVK